VTRHGIHVDRMASAWLIRRFIDTEARFKFVPAKGYKPQSGSCASICLTPSLPTKATAAPFEILLRRFGLTDKALQAIAEIVHDIDLKDAKFTRQETAGMDHLIAGIAMGHKDDAARLERPSAVFDDLYEYLKKKRS
jgi:hypothetical protein